MKRHITVATFFCLNISVLHLFVGPRFATHLNAFKPRFLSWINKLTFMFSSPFPPRPPTLLEQVADALEPIQGLNIKVRRSLKGHNAKVGQQVTKKVPTGFFESHQA